MQTQPLWTPSSNSISTTRMWAFMQSVNQKYNLNLIDYAGLWQWSVDNHEDFWSEFWDFADIIAEKKGTQVLKDAEKMPGAKWFPEARLNFAENLLRYRDQQEAIVFRGEDLRRVSYSYAEIYTAVMQLSSTLRSFGVSKGDVVAGFLPNIPETLIAMLATTSIGAIWTSCSPDFGINGVLDRFGQVKPKVLFTADGYLYNGRLNDSLSRVAQIAQSITAIQKIIVIPYMQQHPDTSVLAQSRFEAFLFEACLDKSATELHFEQVAFDHPLYIMYSSGTTGVPKCIIHSVGGTLLQQVKELMLHTNIGREDAFFYYTTCGWMMWNWMAAGLATGCKLVLFDGSPFAPTPSILWRIAEEEHVSVFGTSAKYLAALEKADVKPGELFHLTSLKALLSTGSPLAPESFEYVYRDIKADLQLSSISGGTDIVSCFALGCPILPVYSGQLQCPGLGMAVDIFDDQGRSVQQVKGELVCKKPFPSMPIGFWNDPNGERYREAYFSTYSNLWAQGDYAEITPEGGVVIHGRSDAVLNPGGVRIGTAEIYRQVEKVGEVLESICIGQPYKDDVRVVLFVKLINNIDLNEDIKSRIKQTIRENATPRHVPAVIIQVADIPRTISGKIVELAVRNVVMGYEVKNKDALANPEALALFRDLPELAV